MEHMLNIGKRVYKGNISSGKPTDKKFKSGLLINTVKDVINHPILDIPAYTFEEDDSYVECRRCFAVNDDKYTEVQKKILNWIKENPIIMTVETGLGKTIKH